MKTIRADLSLWSLVFRAVLETIKYRSARNVTRSFKFLVMGLQLYRRTNQESSVDRVGALSFSEL